MRQERKAEERRKQAREAAEWRKKAIGRNARPNSQQVTGKR